MTKTVICSTKAISEECLIERRLSKMEKKLFYEEVKLKVVFFATSDIVTASGGNDISEDKGENDGEWL